jgi:hypothetical protein
LKGCNGAEAKEAAKQLVGSSYDISFQVEKVQRSTEARLRGCSSARPRSENCGPASGVAQTDASAISDDNGLVVERQESKVDWHKLQQAMAKGDQNMIDARMLESRKQAPEFFRHFLLEVLSDSGCASGSENPLRVVIVAADSGLEFPSGSHPGRVRLETGCQCRFYYLRPAVVGPSTQCDEVRIRLEPGKKYAAVSNAPVRSPKFMALRERWNPTPRLRASGAHLNLHRRPQVDTGAKNVALGGWNSLNYVDENTFKNPITGELLSRTAYLPRARRPKTDSSWRHRVSVEGLPVPRHP